MMQVHATTMLLQTSTMVLVTTLAWDVRTALLPTTTQKRLWTAVTVCTAILEPSSCLWTWRTASATDGTVLDMASSAMQAPFTKGLWIQPSSVTA